MQKTFWEIIMKEKLDIEKMNYLFLDIGVKYFLVGGFTKSGSD